MSDGRISDISKRIMDRLKRLLGGSVSGSSEKKLYKTLISEFDTIGKRSTFFELIINNLLENPDSILSRYTPEDSVEIYYRMEGSDPAIAAAMNTRRAAILNRSWTILQNGSDPAVYEYVRDLFSSIEDLRGTLEDALLALTTGYVPLEIIWQPRGRYWFIKKIVGRDPRNYRFDVEGNLRLLTNEHPLEGEPTPPYKYVVHRHRGTLRSPYGESVLKPLYWPVTFCRAGWKWWATAIERYGMPIITASFPEDATDADRKKFEEFVNSLQAYSWSAVPEGFEIELHEPRRPTAEDYLPFLEYADTKKFQVILGQNLTSETASYGSRAQAVVHNQVRHDIILADASLLEATINDQIIKPAVMLNFSGVLTFPRFKINVAPPYDLATLAKTYDILSKHIELDKDFLREVFYLSGK